MTLIKYPDKLFSVVVPTLGRDTLNKTLASINRDLAEIIVVADTFEMEEETKAKIKYNCLKYNARYREVDSGNHDWGSPQLQHGYYEAKGLYILNCGDDDIYEPMAFETIENAINMSQGLYTRNLCPMMFRTVLHPSPVRGNNVPVVLWHLPMLINKNITGQCFVIPNDQEKIGSWGLLVDYGFITSTVEKFDGEVIWRTEVISQCY